MEFNKIPLFGVIKKRMAWHGQRQEILSQNIANADTPKFSPKDLKPFKFREMIRRETMQVNMDTSESGHLGGRRKRLLDFATSKERRPFETAPAGNAVVLEEQSAKLNENAIGHRLTSELYRKHLTMIKTAIGKK